MIHQGSKVQNAGETSYFWGGVSARGGFTLVEVLVSAIIILLMIMGTTAAMRQGQTVAALDMQRNTVRQAMIAELEKPEYRHELFDSLILGSSNASVMLDDRGTPTPTDDLAAYMTIVADSADYTLNSVVIPRKRVILNANWSSLDGADTLIMEKWICKLLP
jgi:hypothetical protein